MELRADRSYDNLARSEDSHEPGSKSAAWEMGSQRGCRSDLPRQWLVLPTVGRSGRGCGQRPCPAFGQRCTGVLDARSARFAGVSHRRAPGGQASCGWQSGAGAVPLSARRLRLWRVHVRRVQRSDRVFAQARKRAWRLDRRGSFHGNGPAFPSHVGEKRDHAHRDGIRHRRWRAGEAQAVHLRLRKRKAPASRVSQALMLRGPRAAMLQLP